MAGGVIKLAVLATLLSTTAGCATAAPEPNAEPAPQAVAQAQTPTQPVETLSRAAAGPPVSGPLVVTLDPSEGSPLATPPAAPSASEPPVVVEVPATPAAPTTPEVVVIAPPSRTGDGAFTLPTIPGLGTGSGTTGAIPPAAAPRAPVAPAPPPRIREPTPREIASNIAPAFNVDRDYNRLVQCYGTANFAEALFRVQARRAGAGSPAANAAAQTGALKDAMQPLVLAASTVHGEPKFRADYGAVGDRWQREFAAARDPQTVLHRSLTTVNACRADINRWRGGR